jgi:hypothetical protein
VVGVDDGDGPQDSFERIESICGFRYDVDGSGGTPRYRAPTDSLHNWYMSGGANAVTVSAHTS